MLIEFSVKNFLSFKEKVTLSMEKGNGDENLENVITNNITDLLKTAAIYGANASGKSNILKGDEIVLSGSGDYANVVGNKTIPARITFSLEDKD